MMPIRIMNLQNIYQEILNTSLVGIYLPDHQKIPLKEEIHVHTLQN